MRVLAIEWWFRKFILPFIVGGVVCQTAGECEFVWVIVLPEIINYNLITYYICVVVTHTLFCLYRYLPFKEDSDVTAADGAMTSLPMVPLEEWSPDKLEASRRPEDVRLGL